MSERGEIWGIVLAAGDGKRLAGLTASADGVAAPKQFSALIDHRTLLGATLERMSRILPRRRIVVVVAEAHRRFWQRELADWPAENIVVQPDNRGTAAGILLPLLAVTGRDPMARVLVAPSDHYVADEDRWREAMAEALSALERPLERIVLLGVEPERTDADLGWIVPRNPAVGTPLAVARFVEKPSAAEAETLRQAGGLWNSFVLAARAETLLALYVRREPRLLDALVAAVQPRRPHPDRAAALTAVYRDLQPRDFSRDMLAGSEDALVVLPVPACGWTDLGTPARLLRCRGELPAVRNAQRAPRRLRGLAAWRPAASAGLA